MKKILLGIVIISLLILSNIAISDPLLDKHAAWEILRVTDAKIMQYLEEQKMGGAHITVTFSTFSTACMQRIEARTDLGLQ